MTKYNNIIEAYLKVFVEQKTSEEFLDLNEDNSQPMKKNKCPSTCLHGWFQAPNPKLEDPTRGKEDDQATDPI